MASNENDSQSMEYIKASHVGVGNIYAKSFEPVPEQEVQVVESEGPLDNSLVVIDKRTILMKNPMECEPFEMPSEQEMQDLRSDFDNISSS